MIQSVRELRILGEALATIVITWLLLGWFLVDRAITQADGSLLVMPFIESSLDGSADWTDHLYRVGIIGGSKLHEFAGTQPIVQLCNLLGLSTTATVNLMTVLVQLCFAFFGVLALEALVALWSPGSRKLAVTERVIAVWSFAFMPLFAFRIAYGHENLLWGLVPLWTAIALVLAARAKQLGITALVVAAFAVANAVSGLGPQTLAYSVVFGAPLALLALVDAPRGARWTRLHWIALAALACGVLTMLPRLAPMLAHATGPDASRALGESVKEAFDTTTWRDWATSLPWTHELAAAWRSHDYLHEFNFALGPWLVVLPLAWMRGKRLLVGVALGLVLAIMFAQDVEPIASLLGFLDAFRVPARAVLPAAMFIPLLALAALFARLPSPAHPRAHVLGLLGAVALIPVLRHAPMLVVEVLAWLTCVTVVIAARKRPALLERGAPAIAVIAALGVVAFDARFPRHAPYDTIDNGPRALRTAVLAEAPELADPINRIVVRDTEPPFEMSTAFAAQLGSLDGVWYPPKRFLDLLGALEGRAVPATTCVFDVGGGRVFPVLQQLYNVRYAASVRGRSFRALPPPLGAAWFPSELAVIDKPADMAHALGAEADFRPRLASTGFVMRGDSAPSLEPTCANARVAGATSNGQTIVLDVTSPAECVVIVSTNYVSTLRATATVGVTARAASAFPIDIALTGIRIPAHATRVTITPTVAIPWWSRIAQLLGVAALVIAILVLPYRRN